MDIIEANQYQKWWLIKGLILSSLINYINTNSRLTTPQLTSFNIDLTSYKLYIYILKIGAEPNLKIGSLPQPKYLNVLLNLDTI